MTSHRKNNRIVSQGGLTSPKLLRQGPDFPNRSRKRWNGRHVRISCINVTHGLSSVVIISHPNQLHICRTSLFAQSQVLHKCLCESVADLSRCKYVTSSVVFMFTRIVAQMSRCKYVTSSCNYVTVARMSHCCRNVTVADLSRQTPPPMENDPPPMENDPHRWKARPHQWKARPPPMENDPTVEISH